MARSCPRAGLAARHPLSRARARQPPPGLYEAVAKQPGGERLPAVMDDKPGREKEKEQRER